MTGFGAAGAVAAGTGPLLCEFGGLIVRGNVVPGAVRGVGARPTTGDGDVVLVVAAIVRTGPVVLAAPTAAVRTVPTALRVFFTTPSWASRSCKKTSLARR